MAKKDRQFVSVYFDDGLVNNRKKRDVTVAFSRDDSFYRRCRKLASSGIKDAIGIYSYSELVQRANDADRSVGNYIRHKLRIRFEDEEKHTTG